MSAHVAQREPYQQGVNEVLTALDTDARTGLSEGRRGCGSNAMATMN